MTDRTNDDDFMTVAAIGILAFVSADVAHEVVGHGVGLLMAGGRSGIFTTTRLIYESRLPNPNWRIFDMGGPAGNLTWAATCFLAQRMLRGAGPQVRLFLWTTMFFSLFWEFGYLMKCGITGHGDWIALIEGWIRTGLGRVLLFAIGFILNVAAVFFASSELHFVISAKTPQWQFRLVRLLLTLCIAAGTIACTGPVFDPRGQIEILNSGAATSFGSWVGLLFVPMLFSKYSDKNRLEKQSVWRSYPTILFAGAVAIAYVMILGPGVRVSL